MSGYDYYQNLMSWSLPGAVERKDLRAPCAPAGFVEKLIRAARTLVTRFTFQ
jgi:hypothetical protein